MVRDEAISEIHDFPLGSNNAVITKTRLLGSLLQNTSSVTQLNKRIRLSLTSFPFHTVNRYISE